MKQLNEEIKEAVTLLLSLGIQIYKDEIGEDVMIYDIPLIASKQVKANLQVQYSDWYSKVLPVIKQLVPDRYDDFISYYSSKRPVDVKLIDESNYTILDYLNRLRVHYFNSRVLDTRHVFKSKFLLQIGILKAALDQIDSSLNNIRDLVQADLFDGELDSARELHKKQHIRAAGTIAGVVLEKHLENLVNSHGITPKKARLTISDCNEALRGAGVYDIPTWRSIQWLGDIRNLCAHNGDREPTTEEVEGLINGVDRIIKTVH